MLTLVLTDTSAPLFTRLEAPTRRRLSPAPRVSWLTDYNTGEAAGDQGKAAAGDAGAHTHTQITNTNRKYLAAGFFLLTRTSYIPFESPSSGLVRTGGTTGRTTAAPRLLPPGPCFWFPTLSFGPLDRFFFALIAKTGSRKRRSREGKEKVSGREQRQAA